MRINPIFTCIFLVALAGCKPKPKMTLTLPAIFGDHMVLQQQTKAPFWGKSLPETAVRIKASWDQDIETISDENGNWRMDVPTPPAGGPYHVAISSGDSTFHINDVLIGEVWFCSGQSNMEMPLRGWPPNEPVENSNEAIRSAHFPELRFFTVGQKLAITARDDLAGEWEPCNPKTASYFSAVAYFFGKELHQKLGTPVGLIHASWGGSPVEAWTNGKYLSEVEGYEEIESKLKNIITQQQAYDSWLAKLDQADVREKPVGEQHTGLDFWDDRLSTNDYDHSQWADMELPVFWEETELGNFDGVVWFRKTIDIPSNWIGKTLIFELGFIDDMDRSYVNGHQVGGYETIGFWNAPRRYDLPAGHNTTSSISIAVRVIDTGGGGGIYGAPERMRVYPENDHGKAISLAGNWYYLVVGEYRSGIYYKYGDSPKVLDSRPALDIRLDHQTPTALYNGMIAPLIPYSIKGVTWYQGEANVNNAEAYKTLFPAMIENWRTEWGIDGKLPFYFVQIAPYMYSGKDNREAALLRESQRLVNEAIPNTGMAVTLDLGNLRNIHPPKKKEAGERLAANALQNTYGQKHLPFSGPVISGIEVDGKTVRLSFRQIRSGLMAKGGILAGFEIAGPDGKFTEASARISGENILVDNPENLTKVTIRYAFRNGSAASLFNKDGFPASTFEISNEYTVQ